MNDGNIYLGTCSSIVGGAVIVSAAFYIAWKWARKSKRKECPKDTVVLHQLPRGPYAPSISQFVLKFETYLRMAKIPYVNVHGLDKGKKGKWPWMEFNGEELCDSEFMIEFLNKKFEVNLDGQYSEKEKAIARAFLKMMEDSVLWATSLDRWGYDKNETGLRLLKAPFFVRYSFGRYIKKAAYYQGMGRHEQDEVYHILDADLRALSQFLGSKKFLLGDEPCQADAGVFGQLGQIYWHSFGNPCYSTYLKKYTNLCDYCERMKERFWTDWEQCITKGGTQKATK